MTMTIEEHWLKQAVMEAYNQGAKDALTKANKRDGFMKWWRAFAKKNWIE